MVPNNIWSPWRPRTWVGHLVLFAIGVLAVMAWRGRSAGETPYERCVGEETAKTGPDDVVDVEVCLSKEGR